MALLIFHYLVPGTKSLWNLKPALSPFGHFHQVLFSLRPQCSPEPEVLNFRPPASLPFCTELIGRLLKSRMLPPLTILVLERSQFDPYQQIELPKNCCILNQVFKENFVFPSVNLTNFANLKVNFANFSRSKYWKKFLINRCLISQNDFFGEHWMGVDHCFFFPPQICDAAEMNMIHIKI